MYTGYHVALEGRQAAGFYVQTQLAKGVEERGSEEGEGPAADSAQRQAPGQAKCRGPMMPEVVTP